MHPSLDIFVAMTALAKNEKLIFLQPNLARSEDLALVSFETTTLTQPFFRETRIEFKFRALSGRISSRETGLLIMAPFIIFHSKIKVKAYYGHDIIIKIYKS